METGVRYIAAKADDTPSNPCDSCREVCCRCFPLPYDPATLQVMARDRPNSDAAYAAKNFIFLGHFQFNPLFPWRSARPSSNLPYFSCKHISWDGKCQDYENRPGLCRNYGVSYLPDVGCALRREYEEKHTEECNHRHYCKLLSAEEPVEEIAKEVVTEENDYPK